MRQRPLFDAFPRLLERLPVVDLGRFPTRVEKLDGLLPPAVELWVKRDDESGGEYGGNKVRKLELLLGAARARGARRVLTIGGFGSHHVLATAIYGSAAGLGVEAVVFPQPLTPHVLEQLLADQAAGAKLIAVDSYLHVPLAIWRRRRRPGTVWLAAGGSSPIGTFGYVDAALELARQVADGVLPRPDAVYVALGTCGTAAGLLAGLRAPHAAELVAVRVVDRVVAGARHTRRLAAAVERLIEREHPEGLARLGPAPVLRVDHRFFGGGYGVATPEAEAAVRAAAAVGLRLEPTYTGKAMAALLADAHAGRLDGKRVLFWHTYSGVDLGPLIARSPGPAALPPRLAALFHAQAANRLASKA